MGTGDITRPEREEQKQLAVMSSTIFDTACGMMQGSGTQRQKVELEVLKQAQWLEEETVKMG